MNAHSSMQAAFAGWLLHGDEAFACCVQGPQVGDRLRIYADAYRLRLVEVLGDDFPGTKAALGGDAFDALAARYLREHPSTRPSVRHFGAAFADWLAAQADAPAGAQASARLEWAQAECFDAPDAPALGMQAVAALPPEAWPALRLALHPAVRLPPRCACWRDAAGEVQWRELEADEAEALSAIGRGASFGHVCGLLATHHGEAGAARAASLLKRWLLDGLLADPTHRGTPQ